LDALPEMSADMRRRIQLAVDSDGVARFER
jgi:hypothetical protein